jgi:short-subunit dehydrogenase
MGMFGYTGYGTSKFALVGFSECIRGELKRHGITLTLVCPPVVETPFLTEEAITIPPESVPIKYTVGLLDPEPVARAILKGIRKRKYFVMPGLMLKLVYLSHRLTNGRISRFVADMIVKKIARKRKKAGS